MRTLIVDDEPLARRRIRSLLEREAGLGEIEEIDECEDGREASRRIAERRPDLVFLDVQMPEMDGFEVIRTVGADRFPAVVFVTAYDQYALRAFEAHACDYLLKPFSDARFARTLEWAWARRREEKLDELADRLSGLLERLPAPGRPLARLGLRSAGIVRFLDVEDIDWIEADGKGVLVHSGGVAHPLRESIGRLEERLDPARFLRVHRCAIVHIERIATIEGSAGNGRQMVTLKDGTRLPLARSNRLRIVDLVSESAGA